MVRRDGQEVDGGWLTGYGRPTWSSAAVLSIGGSVPRLPPLCPAVLSYSTTQLLHASWTSRHVLSLLPLPSSEIRQLLIGSYVLETSKQAPRKGNTMTHA